MGVLDAVTTKEDARIRDVNGTDRSEIVEPLANYFIARLKRDLREGNTSIGAALTGVNRSLDDPALAPLFRRAAYVGGLDWNHAWSNQTWAFDGAVLFSQNLGSAEAIDALQRSPARYFQRPDKVNFREDPTKTSLTGYVAEMTLAKLSGVHWTGSVSYQEYSPSFEINESGFLGSTDMRSVTPIIEYHQRTPTKHFRSWGQFLFWNPSWDFDRNLTYNGVGAITRAELPNFWNYFLRFDWRPVIDNGLTRGGPLAGLTTGGGVQLEITTDRRRQYQFDLFTSYSFNKAGGRGVNINPSLTFRPSSAVAASHASADFQPHACDGAVRHTRY